MLVFRLVHLFFFWSNHHLVLSKSMLAPLCELGLVYLRVTRVIVPPLQVRMVTCSFLERAFKGRLERPRGPRRLIMELRGVPRFEFKK